MQMTPPLWQKVKRNSKASSKRRNKPEYLPETANAIAQIKGIPVEEMSEILYQNSLAAFHLTEA